jgi:hypothetical protein
MANYSTGGFVCLPGGYGTFEEMMEMITWNQVRYVVSTLEERLTSSSESTLYLLWCLTVCPYFTEGRLMISWELLRPHQDIVRGSKRSRIHSTPKPIVIDHCRSR